MELSHPNKQAQEEAEIHGGASTKIPEEKMQQDDQEQESRMMERMMEAARDPDQYEKFYAEWLEMQRVFLGELQAALSREASDQQLKELVQKAAMHYSYYYRIKEEISRYNILQFFAPGWKTPLESAFMWIGGWRPSLVFQLAYAQAGQQIEAELAELIAGIDEPKMALITAVQLERINELHVKTLQLEEEFSRHEASLQQALADQPFVSLAQQSVSGQLATTGAPDEAAIEETMEAVEENMEEKLKELRELLGQADHLRAETIQGLLGVFTTVQAAQFLVAAAQLQLVYRALGNKLQQEEGQEEMQDA